MNVLVIDNTMDADSWGASEIRKLLSKTAPGISVRVRRSPQMDLPADLIGIDRLVLTGSRASCLEEAPWVGKLDALLRRAIDSGLPILGLCYGHQSLIRVIGGRGYLKEADRGEYGWTRIRQIGSNPILKGLPNEFYSYSSHVEQAHALPPELRSVAASDLCPIQGFVHEEKPVFGLQFHPEKGPESELKTLASLKKKGRQEWFSGQGQARKRFDKRVGEKVFENFIQWGAS